MYMDVVCELCAIFVRKVRSGWRACGAAALRAAAKGGCSGSMWPPYCASTLCRRCVDFVSTVRRLCVDGASTLCRRSVDFVPTERRWCCRCHQ